MENNIATSTQLKNKKKSRQINALLLVHRSYHFTKTEGFTVWLQRKIILQKKPHSFFNKENCFLCSIFLRDKSFNKTHLNSCETYCSKQMFYNKSINKFYHKSEKSINHIFFLIKWCFSQLFNTFVFLLDLFKNI